jgi:hypothetical protein
MGKSHVHRVDNRISDNIDTPVVNARMQQILTRILGWSEAQV